MMVTGSVKVINEIGLHATPLAQFVTLARSFTATEIRVNKDGKEADGKSLIFMLALEALQGATISISANGPQAEEAVQALVGLVSSGFTRK